jgi:hypothetical protein
MALIKEITDLQSSCTTVKEDDVVISSSLHALPRVVDPTTGLTDGICNAVWTDEVKTAYETAQEYHMDFQDTTQQWDCTGLSHSVGLTDTAQRKYIEVLVAGEYVVRVVSVDKLEHIEMKYRKADKN